MKRLVLSLLFFFFVGQVNAQSIQSTLPQSPGFDAPQGTVAIVPPPTQNPPFLGQDHYYSVQFRGNGEAVVNLKTIFSNLQETELTNVTFRAPKGVVIENLLAYQILREPQCIRYRMPSICEEYGQPDYFNYDYTTTKYQKALSTNDDGIITVTLPQSITPNTTGSLIVYFTSPNYVNKNSFGAFEYAFGSLRVEDKIRTLQIGISAESDWYLKGVSGKVQYSLSESAVSFKDSALSKPVMHPQFMNYYQEVGQGALVKNASNLQPLDSYLVEGSYAASQGALYGKQILIGLVTFVLMLFFVGFLVRLLIRKFRSPTVSHSHNFLTASTTSFISAFLGVGYTIFSFFLLNAMNNGQYYEWIGVFSVLLTLISIGVYIVIFVIPAVFIGLKRSVSWGVITITLTIGWLMLFSMLIFVVLFLFRGGGQPIYPTMYEKAIPTLQYK